MVSASPRRARVRKFNRTLRQQLVLLLLTVIIFGTMLVSIRRLGTDYGPHIDFAQAIAEGQFESTIRSPHILYQLLVILAKMLFFLPTYWHAGFLVSFLAYIATAFLVYRYLLHSLDIYRPRRHWIAVGLSISLLLVSHVIVTWHEQNMYMGYIVPNVYHSPTMVVVKPLALLLFWATATLLTDGRSLKLWLPWLCLLTMATILAKPNYILAFMPATVCLVALRFIQRQPVPLGSLIWGIGIPTFVLLSLQFVMSYAGGTSDGLAIAPFAFFERYGQTIPMLLVKLLASVAFPLAVLLCVRHTLHQDVSLQLAWLTFVFAAAQNYLLIETGERLGHGNWLWGAQTALFVLMVMSVRSLLQNGTILSQWQHRLCMTLFALHLLSGIAFLLLHIAAPSADFYWQWLS